MTARVWLCCLPVLLSACTAPPPVPDWQLNAHRAVEQATQAELEGHARLAALQWQRAFDETRRTADPARWARLWLVQCAVQHASLAEPGCAGWQAWAADAPEADQAYARYLSGQPLPTDVARLPLAHQRVAQALLAPTPGSDASVLHAVIDPLARLVAASSLRQAQRLSPEGIAVAVATAADMGWRRPLMAWLTWQAEAAQARGDRPLAEQAQRRLALLSAAAATPPAPAAD
jgi:hypothetical protein